MKKEAKGNILNSSKGFADKPLNRFIGLRKNLIHTKNQDSPIHDENTKEKD